jgi:hypothetical protein
MSSVQKLLVPLYEKVAHFLAYHSLFATNSILFSNNQLDLDELVANLFTRRHILSQWQKPNKGYGLGLIDGKQKV